MSRRAGKRKPSPAAPAVPAWKRRIFFAAVAFLALWPVAHHGLVARFDLDPWMHFGVSMYTRPRPMTLLRGVEVATADGPLRSVRKAHLVGGVHPGSFVRRADPLARQQWGWGRLQRPEGIVADLFAMTDPRVERLVFTIERLELGEDAFLEARDVRYECTRDGPRCRRLPDAPTPGG